jgi:hypothetical protein
MSKNATWILVIVFLALLALLLWMPRLQEMIAQPTVTPTITTEKLFTFQASDVRAVRVVSSTGKAFTAQRDSSNAWLADGITDLDSAVVEQAVNQLAGVTILSQLEDSSDLSQYGLGYPAEMTLSLTLQDGTQYQMHIGSITPTGRGYYVLTNEDRLVALSKYSLEKLLGFAENPPLATPTPTPTSVPTPTPTLAPE